MLTSPTKIPIRIGIFLAGVVLVVGCDATGPGAKETNKVSYEVTNDLDSRLTVADAAGASSAAAAPSKGGATTFSVIAQVAPPDVDEEGGDERASHVHYSAHHDKLYAGYMIRGDGPGNGFGGGVDIIDLSDPSDPASPPGSNALAVEGVDVQESTTSRDVLMLGVAEEESFDIGNTPSEVHTIHIDGITGLPVTSGGTIEFEDMDLPGDLVKGVTRASSSDDTHNFYAVTDANTFHQLEVGGVADIRDITTDATSNFPGLEFRGVAANGDGGWAMDDGGNLWRSDPSTGGLSRETEFSPPDFFGGSPLRSIARVSAGGPKCNGTKLIFTALNNDGFRAIVTGTGDASEVFRNKSLEVTSVTATKDFVYVASGTSIALYAIDHSEICSDDTDEGLRRIGMTEVRDFRNGSLFDFDDQGQVNQIEATTYSGTDYVFVAKGEDGVIILEQGGASYP